MYFCSWYLVDKCRQFFLRTFKINVCQLYQSNIYFCPDLTVISRTRLRLVYNNYSMLKLRFLYKLIQIIQTKGKRWPRLSRKPCIYLLRPSERTKEEEKNCGFDHSTYWAGENCVVLLDHHLRHLEGRVAQNNK